MKNNKGLRLALKTSSFLAAAALVACASPSSSNPNPTQQGAITHSLPFYGNHDVQLINDGNGALVTDTAYFTVPYFAFINQDSVEITGDDYLGYVYVADYFFTTCPTICPMMSAQMSRLQDLLKNAQLWGDVRLLSHTVDPTNDTPDALRAYGERLNADFSNWNFVTGNRDELYDQAKFGYFLTALPSDTAAGGFFHSDTFALIDREGRIRGYYDGTSTQEVDQLFNDIKYLVNEPHGVD